MPELLSRLRDFLSGWLAPGPTPEPGPTPGPMPEPVPPPEPVPAPPSPESAVAAAINAVRASNGLASLAEDDSLARQANSWAASMASSGDMEHGDFAGRIAATYPNTAAAENIAEGQPDATTVVDAWMGDPPHRANILGDYNRLGVGAERDANGSLYWCVDFAQVG